MKNLSKPVKIAIIIAIAVIVLTIIVAIASLISASSKRTLEIYDQKTGYKTTFKYPAKKGYSVEKSEENTGTFPSVTFVNEEKNIKCEIYYYETSNSLFERNKSLRENSDNYKEFTINGYNGYSYTAGLVLQSDILLKKSEDDRNLVLYIFMEKYDEQKDGNMNEIFNSNEMQEILKTIKFEQVAVE